MQKPKVGSVVVLAKDLSAGVNSLITKGTLGVVLKLQEDPKSWGIQSLVVDFGGNSSVTHNAEVTDMSFILPYEMPKEAKTKKPKDTVAAKL